jgi:DNA repair protein RadC
MHGFIDYCRLVILVLKAQEKAFSSLSGIGHAKLGTMTSLVAVANTIVQEVANDLQMSLKFPVTSPSNPKDVGSMDNVGILKV